MVGIVSGAYRRVQGIYRRRFFFFDGNFFLQVHFCRCPVAEILMRAPVVVERKVFPKPVPRRAGIGIRGNKYIFILHRAPQPFRKNGSATITINSFSDPFRLLCNAGNTDNNAETLLHELGHVYDLIRGSGGSAIKTRIRSLVTKGRGTTIG